MTPDTHEHSSPAEPRRRSAPEGRPRPSAPGENNRRADGRPRQPSSAPAPSQRRQGDHPRPAAPRQPADRRSAAPRQGREDRPWSADPARREPTRRSGGKYARPRKRKNPMPLLIGLTAVLVCLLIWLCVSLAGGSAPQKPSGTVTLPPQAAPRAAVVSTASVGAMGDMLMHRQLNQVAKQEDGTYDYSYIFRHMGNYISGLDYAAANLETTFGGPDCGTPYQGNPLFNTPDGFADSLKAAGFDMLLTANNHCGDTKAEGIIRTVNQVRSRGLTALGTLLSEEEPRYEVVDLNGIKVGMVCYTYATDVTADGRPRLNLNAYLSQAGLVNFFTESDLGKFYEEMAIHLEEMRQEGADLSVVYLHWGREYELTPLPTQQAIAQKLCDMGVDVIVGGHPHVVEPMDLLTSHSDPDHKTVVLYSMGNAVSNQRRENMDLNTGHTEDGLLFTMTFEKYSDGKAYLADVDVLPFWVKMVGDYNNPVDYCILPLDPDRSEQWRTMFELNEEDLEKAFKSYDRTMEIVGEGLQECREYLSQAKIRRDQDPEALDQAA